MNKLFFESKIGEGLISKGIFGKNVESRNELILKHQEEKYWLIKICILICFYKDFYLKTKGRRLKGFSTCFYVFFCIIFPLINSIFFNFYFSLERRF